MELTHVSLFSGIGGIDLAAEVVGFRTVLFCEIDPFCRRVLRKHWPHVPIVEDIHDLSVDLIRSHLGGHCLSLISGGDPCQPYSHSGKREGAADDRYLWPEMFRLITGLRPTFVLRENVAGNISLGLDRVLSDLENIGYATKSFVIPACAIGAEHRRDRVWVAAYDPCQRMERVRPERQQVAHPLAESLLPLRNSDGEWQVEPDLRRTTDGVSNWVDRLRALGNAIQPQVARVILAALLTAIIQKGDANGWALPGGKDCFNSELR